MAIPEGRQTCQSFKYLDRRTVTKRPVDIIEESNGLANENPGATAIATGEKQDIEALQLRANDSAETEPRHAHSSDETPKGDEPLSPAYTALVENAFASLVRLQPDDAELTAQAAIEHAGSPLPPFLAPMSDARFWASMASRAELKAYCWAAWEALSQRDQAAFLAKTDDRRAAA